MLDLFLPMLDEARLAEAGTGKVADFTQAIFTGAANGTRAKDADDADV